VKEFITSWVGASEEVPPCSFEFALAGGAEFGSKMRMCFQHPEGELVIHEED